MLVKQFNIKVFEVEIENENEFIEFIEKNSAILKTHLLSIKGNISKNIETVLNKYALHYINNLNIKGKKDEKALFTKQSSIKIVDSIVRSGQEIIYDGDMVLLKRVNSGATIKCNGNLISLESVDGFIECNGDFMLIKSNKRASIIFNGLDISKNIDNKKLYKVKLNKDEILIA